MPLIAGGAAAAGLAGGLAVINRRRAATRHRGGIDFDGIVAAAQRLGSFGEEIGRVASMIQQANEVSGKS
jgi:hypothetical protein